MIKKILNITGTGKFLNYQLGGENRPNDFEQINLIYGENGSGKTTLMLILRSLKGEKYLLPKVRSFDRNFDQNIEILFNNGSNVVYKYENNNWDNNFTNIEIFDTHFINQNIYTGLEINHEHKKNLYEVLFGDEGIQFKKEIQDIKKRIAENNSIKREIERLIEAAINNIYKADEFCKIIIDDNIDEKLIEKEKELGTAKSFSEIKTQPNLLQIPRFEIPFNDVTLIEILEKSLDNIDDKYIELFNDHKEHLNIESSKENWIKIGFDAIEDETCPFCLRVFEEPLDIIESYKQYFNVEYNSLIDSLSYVTQSVNNYSVDSVFLSIENVISRNLHLLNFWKNHIDQIPKISSIMDERNNFSEKYSIVQEIINSKTKNPIKSFSSKSIPELINFIKGVNDKIDHFNSQINKYNELITELKSGDAKDEIAIGREYEKLKIEKKRFDPKLEKSCKALFETTALLTSLNVSKEEKQGQLHEYSVKMFEKYGDTINEYLSNFASYLEIRNFDSGYIGSSQDPIIKYGIFISGNEIYQDESSNPNFKYTVSEGDKGSIALAFFLAKLKVDNNLREKIIVFDDPVSSFDLNRKATTISKLLDLGKDANQLIVLSHNIYFAGEFWNRTRQTGRRTSCNQINFMHNSAQISSYNINSNLLASVIKDSKEMKKFVSDGCVNDTKRRSIARCIRPSLEGYFRLKFFDEISDNDWLGSFILNIRESDSSSPFYRLRDRILSELTDINDYSKKYHHSLNNDAHIEPINDAELRNYCSRTLDMIQKI